MARSRALGIVSVGAPLDGIPYYYVDATNGDDSLDGRSPGRAWQTISKVNGWTFTPGDRIRLKRGETWREQLVIPSSGISGNPILLGAYSSGALPVITGADVITGWASYNGNTWESALATEPYSVFIDDTKLTKGADRDSLDDHEWVWAANVLYVRDETGDPDVTDVIIEASKRNYAIYSEQSFITIKNINLKATNDSALLVNTNGANCEGYTLDSLTIEYVGACAIEFVGNGGDSVPDNTAQRCTINYWDESGSGGHSAIAFYGNGGNDITVDGNTVVGDIPYLVDTNKSANGIEIFSGAKPVVTGNNITGSDHGIVLGAGTTAWNVSFNYVHQTGDDSIWILGNDADGLVSYNLLVDSTDNLLDTDNGSADDAGRFYNNTLYNSEDHGPCIFISTISGRHMVFKNNIVYTSSAEWVFIVHHDATVAACTFDNNCYFNFQFLSLHADGAEFRCDTLVDWQTKYSQDPNSIESDPSFVNLGTDFHLQAGSPCRDAGVDVGLTQDYDSVSVPQETNPAIGAYEYVA